MNVFDFTLLTFHASRSVFSDKTSIDVSLLQNHNNIGIVFFYYYYYTEINASPPRPGCRSARPVEESPVRHRRSIMCAYGNKLCLFGL